MVASDYSKNEDDFEYISIDDSICRSHVFRGGYQGEQCYGNKCYAVYEALCYDRNGDLVRVGSFIRKK